MSAFLDTNIFIYHLTNNHSEFSPRCSALLFRIESGEIQAHTSVTAIDEALRVLTKFFGHERAVAAEMFATILATPDIRIEHRSAVLAAMSFWQAQSSLSFVDCYHLTLAEELGIKHVYSFDKRMDRYPGVERVEPE